MQGKEWCPLYPQLSDSGGVAADTRGDPSALSANQHLLCEHIYKQHVLAPSSVLF